MESDFIIVEKPESVSWDEIHEVIDAAHSTNRAAGINMVNSSMTGEQLRKRVGSGKCFVAMVGDKVVGTASYEIKHITAWYAKGESSVAHLIFGAVLPEYRGYGVYAALCKERERAIINDGISLVDFDTSEDNVRIQTVNERNSFVKVGLRAYKTSYYSVKMAKWLNGCPYSRVRVSLMNVLSIATTKLRFKRGGIKRFGI